jgi:hypothetical protein
MKLDNSKVFVCIVLHHSDLRPEGEQMAEEFFTAWKNGNFPYSLVVLDNESTCSYEKYLDGIDHHFIRIDDQLANGAITGAWNQVCKFAIDQGAEIITGFNDDVKLDQTFPKFIEAIVDHNTVYGPVTNGIKSGPWQSQKSSSTKPGWTSTVRTLNGFWIGFTRNFYLDKAIDSELFIRGQYSSMNLNDWSGQEAMFDHWKSKFSTQCKIIGDCWINHTKLRSWTKAKERYL